MVPGSRSPLDAYEQARAQFLINKDAITLEKLAFDDFFQGTRDHFTTKLPYLRQLYDLYERNLDFRAACNDFLYFHNVHRDEFLKFLRQNIYFDDGTKKPDDIRMNAIIQINGHVRTGKSRLALVVALLICLIAGLNPRIHIDPNDPENFREFILFPGFTSWKYLIFPQFSGFLDIFVTYGLDQARHTLPLMPPGSICWNDETLLLHEEGAQKEKDNLMNAINAASGRRCLNFIFLCPKYVDLPQVDYFLTILAVNYPKRRTLAMLSVHQEKSSIMNFIGVVNFNVTVSREILDYYDEFSEKIKARIQELAGASKPKKGDVTKSSKILINAFNNIDDLEDLDYYESSKDAFLEFADTVDASEGWSDRLMKAAAKRACYFLGIGKGSKEDAPARHPKILQPKDAKPTDFEPLSSRMRRRADMKAFLKSSHISDEVILQQELANVGDDTRRHTFLQNGLNVPRLDIDAYFDGKMTMDELKAISCKRMAEAKRAVLEEQIWPVLALLFRTDEEIRRDAAEAERRAWLEKVAEVESKIKANSTNSENTGENVSNTSTESRQSPIIIPGKPFEFDIEQSFADYIKKHKNDERGVEIFKDLQLYSIPAVMRKYPNQMTGKPLTKNGVIKIENRVGGWLSLAIGHAYEPHLAAQKAEEFKGKLARPPRCEGVQGQKQPDVVCELLGGDFIVYSLKARYSATSETQTMDIVEFQAEIDEFRRLAAARLNNRGRFFVVYYDHNIHQRTEKEIADPANPPSSIRLSRVKGAPEIVLMY